MAREELYRAFGPKLMEAMALVIIDEINILRAEHGLADRTSQQIVTVLETKLATIPDYDWMSEGDI